MREERIEEMRWDVAGTIPDEEQQVLSPSEKRFNEEYNELLGAYQVSPPACPATRTPRTPFLCSSRAHAHAAPPPCPPRRRSTTST